MMKELNDLYVNLEFGGAKWVIRRVNNDFLNGISVGEFVEEFDIEYIAYRELRRLRRYPSARKNLNRFGL